MRSQKGWGKPRRRPDPMFFVEREGLIIAQFETFSSQEGIAHGISTRLGGESEGPFASLNQGWERDRPEAVLANRRRFFHAMGHELEDAILGQQVHGERVAVVGEGERGRGALDRGTAIPATDALVTDVSGIPLMIRVADCVPLLLLDPRRRAIGVTHAGWQGTIANITQKTVAAMVSAFGCRPGDIMAGIGPSIGPCCYEVDEVVLAPLRGAFPGIWPKLVELKGNGKGMLDLWEANRAQLLEAGLNEEKIEVAKICTGCRRDLFYSERKDGRPTGRFGAALCLC